MSKYNSSLQFVARTSSKTSQSEGNENEFENLLKPISFPPARAPLNTISDPCQYQKETHEFDNIPKDRLEAIRAVCSSDTKFEGSDHYQLTTLSKRTGNIGPNYETSNGRNSSVENSEIQAKITDFELEEDSSFWNDHNVKVPFIILFCLFVIYCS